jgi:MFS family permease
MAELSLHNIDRIARDVRKENIILTHLADELIDHLCCDVEQEMAGGMDFPDAYRRVKEKMGYRRLKEIQEETLYAVDTKYRNMKKTMKISAIAGTIMLGFAALFKIMHWPWAGIMLTLGAFILAFVFMPSALTVLWKETRSRKRLFLYISAFVASMLFILGVVAKVQHWPFAGLILLLAVLSIILAFIPALLAGRLKEEENPARKLVYILGAAGISAFVLGILCKIQHWPLASLFLICGVVITFLLFVPWYTFISWKSEKNVSAQFIFMVIGSVAIVIPGLLLNLSLQHNYEAGYYRQIREQQALFSYRFTENQSFITGSTGTVAAPVLAEINASTTELISFINDIEAELVAAAEGTPKNPAVITRQGKETDSGMEIQFETLIKPFNPVPFTEFLNDTSGSRTELGKRLKAYSDYLSDLVPESGFISYLKLLDPSVYLPEADPETTSISLFSGLHMLELMKSGIVTVEHKALSALSEN